MGADCTQYGRLLETYENNFTQGVDCYPRTRSDAFNILANYKEGERNYMQVVQSNDRVAFTTLDNSDTHHNTNETNMTHMDDLSTTSNLTASTNPQQHGSTMVTTGVDMVTVIMHMDQLGVGEARGTQLDVFVAARPGTMPLHDHTPLRRPNGACQLPNLLMAMATVKQPNNCLCLGPSVEHQ